MTPEFDGVRELALLLNGLGAHATLMRDRIGLSTFYDTDYHLAMIACGFAIHARTDDDGRRRVLTPWLKLLQFVAARPHLVADMEAWAQGRRKADLETWRRMPRGYVGDRTHDGVVDFLVAASVLGRDKDDLLGGPRVALLDTLYRRLVSEQLFVRERGVFNNLRTVRASKKMLGGA